MKRLFGPLLALVVLVAAAIAITSYVTEESAGAALVLAEVEGVVVVVGADATERGGRAGLELVASERVRTGEDGRAVVALGNDTRIRLRESSSIQVLAVDEDEVRIELEDGLLHATVRPASGAVRISSKDREILATNAEFDVGKGDDDTLAVETQRGDLMLRGIPGASEVREGQRLIVTSAGHAELGAIPDELLLDVSWPPNELAKGTPTYVLEGRSAPGSDVRITTAGRVYETRAGPDGAFDVELLIEVADQLVVVETVDVLGKGRKDSGRVTRLANSPSKFSVIP